MPLDVDPGLHFLVSAPALALAAVPALVWLPLIRKRGPLRGVLVGILLLALAAGLAVALWLEAPLPGALERLAVWPSTLLIALLGVRIWRRGPEEPHAPPTRNG
ncbi:MULTISPECIES: hypothetical protein [unclassified Luteococcus]|uniref:hypothetical protein n=1 Tax=unclassified Luteococcus TaxID=2639923 RepID=UPI00313A889A